VFDAADGTTPILDKDGNPVYQGRIQSTDAFCGSKDTISNKFLREFLLSQWNDYYCDPYSKIQVTEDDTVKRRQIKD